MKLTRNILVFTIIGISSLLVLLVSSKIVLERLIHDNYTKRIERLLPDKLYWADDLYMKTICSINLDLCKDFYQAELKRIRNAKI